MVLSRPITTTTAEVRTASDICTEERNTTMNQDKFDDEYLRSIQEGLERMLEELLKEEE